MTTFKKNPFCLLMFSALLFSGIQHAAAQEKKKPQVALKSYINSRLFLGEDRNIQSGLVSFAVTRIKENRNFQEYELSRIEQSSNYYPLAPREDLPFIQGVQIEREALKLRYEYAACLLKKESKFAPYLGISASPYIVRNTTYPLNTMSFPSTTLSYGVNISLVPRIQWNLGNRLFLDLNAPLTIFDGARVMNRVENPLYPVSQQSTYTFDVSSLADISFRLGLGVKL